MESTSRSESKSLCAKAVKSNKWFVRIDGNKEFLKEKTKKLGECIDVVAILGAFHLGEKGENPHIHFVIESRNVTQKQSFQVRIKELFGITKKSEYAVGVWDGERGNGACSYLFHEPSAEIICNRGFTDDDIERAKLANDAVQRVVKINKEKASHKLTEKAYLYFTEKDAPEFSKVECLEVMLKAIKAGENYHPGEYKLKQYVEEIEVRLCENVRTLAWEMTCRLWK